MNKLIITDDEGKTTVVPLVRDEITIGRREGNTIRLTERNISRRHAKLSQSNGSYVVEDLVSYNGVKVNGIPVDAETPRAVQDGDRISIGDYQLSLRSDRPVAAVAPAPEAPAAEPPPHPRLVMLGPPDAGSEFVLDEPEIVVGRTDENGIVINHRSISRSHARVVVDNDKVRLFDLESANGVRVNGEDFTEVELRRGDLVELGTVRLRFVAAGEVYQFDADATVQMETVPEDILAEVGGRPVIPIALIVAVVVMLLVGVLIAWAVLSSQTDPDVVTTAEGPEVTEVGENPTPAVPTGPTAEEVKARARDLMEQNEFEAVMGVLASLGPSSDPEVSRLRSKAALEQESRQLWNTACQEAEEADVTGVYLTCKRIKGESRFYHLGCCEKAADRFGAKQLEEIKGRLRGREYQEAVDLAKAVTEDLEISEGIRDDAERLFKRAERRVKTTEVAVATPRPKTKSPVRPSPGKNPATPTKPPAPKVKNRPAPASGDAVSTARSAYLRGDYATCIRTLGRSGKSRPVVSVLIMCYQGAGKISSACRLAKSYQQYPNALQFYNRRCR